jgi:glutathione synthase/RimK-type ligase-like ATP-grasp enzyme
MSGVFTVAVGLTNSAVVVSSVVITGIFFIIITIQYLQSWLRARGKKALEQREKDREEQRESDYDAYLQRTNPRVAQTATFVYRAVDDTRNPAVHQRR